MPTDTSTDLVSEFYPLTRQQLEVPSIPLLRLQPLTTDVAEPGTPAPHFTPRQTNSNPFTVAARTSDSIPLTSPSEQSPRHLPEVRFAVSTSWDIPSSHYASKAGWENAELLASTASGRVAAAAVPRDGAQSGMEREPNRLGATYPFWMTALAQIVIGTLVVILLVKFANLVRDSFGAQHPVSAATVMRWQEESDRPQPLVQPSESAACETEHWL